MDWLRLLGNPRIQFRINIAEIILTECELPSFNLIENAFQMSDRSMAGQ